MKLKIWLIENRKTSKEFCSQICYRPHYISSCMSGKLFPGRKLIDTIKKITLGQVTESDWTGIKKLKTVPKKKRNKIGRFTKE